MATPAKFTLKNISALQLMQNNDDITSGVCITPTNGGMSVDGNVDIGGGLSVTGLGHFTGGVSISGGASIGPLFIGDNIQNVARDRVLIISGDDGQIGTSAFPGGGGGATNPAGSNTQIQYNNSGAFGASPNFTFDQDTAAFGLSGSISVLGGPITLDTTAGVSSVRIQDNTTNQGGEIILYSNSGGGGTSVINLVADGNGGENFIQLNSQGGSEVIRLETLNTGTGFGPALLLTNSSNTTPDVELYASGPTGEEGELLMFTKATGGTSTISVNLRAGKTTGAADRAGGILELNRLDTTGTGTCEQIITLDSTTQEIYINNTSGVSRAVLDGSTGSGRLRLRDANDIDRVELVGVSGGITLRNQAGVSTFIGVSVDASTTAVRFVLPGGNGNNGQVLQTDGNGNLSYVAQTGGGGGSGVSELGELNDAYTDASNITLGVSPAGIQNNTFNTAVGISALFAITSGLNNIAVGYNSGESLESGSQNVAIGVSALRKEAQGSGSVAIGYLSLREQFQNTTANVYNTAVGWGAGSALTTGTSCTFIGASSGSTGNGDIIGSNITCLGFGAQPSLPGTSNEVTLGNTHITTLRCADQTIASLSDARDKNDIRDLSYGLNFLENVRPVEFTWDRRVLTPDDNNDPKQGKRRAGFIAQELQEAMPEGENDILDLVYTSNPQRLEAKYGNLIPVMVKAIQDLKQEVDTIKEHLNLE